MIGTMITMRNMMGKKMNRLPCYQCLLTNSFDSNDLDITKLPCIHSRCNYISKEELSQTAIYCKSNVIRKSDDRILTGNRFVDILIELRLLDTDEDIKNRIRDIDIMPNRFHEVIPRFGELTIRLPCCKAEVLKNIFTKYRQNINYNQVSTSIVGYRHDSKIFRAPKFVSAILVLVFSLVDSGIMCPKCLRESFGRFCIVCGARNLKRREGFRKILEKLVERGSIPP